MSIEQNKTVLRRLLSEVISKGDYALADELVAVDFVSHQLRPGQGQGLDGFKQGLRVVRAAFPDWESVVDELLGEGDMVAARWTAHGTHQGAFAGIPPTGRRIKMKEMGIFRVVSGKLVEYWGLADELALMQQLGVLPSMEPPSPEAR
jgi:steroid delta-isomerase-like uncharacterized protein